MKNMPTKKIFKKVLVPVIYGCDQTSAINAARAIAGEDDVMFLGLLYVPEGESLSSATTRAREVRQALQSLSNAQSGHRWTEVYATHHPWNEIVKITKKETPDLLILQYPCHFESLGMTPTEVLTNPPCDLAIVNQRIPVNLQSILVAIRGGPYSELALRIALSIEHFCQVEITSLHVIPAEISAAQDSAFRGIERVLKNLPEVKKVQMLTDSPAEFIFESSHQFDFIVMGASARPEDQVASIGPVAEKIMRESQQGVMIVKTEKAFLMNLDIEEIAERERPPIIELSEYCERLGLTTL